MKSQILAACFLALVLSASAAVSANSLVVVPPTTPLQIVTCREDADMEALLNEFQLVPRFKYRAINGFAALMNEATIHQLKSDARVLYVEADGPVGLCVQTNATGLVRIGVDQFPVARINGIAEPLDVDVAVLDSGIGPHSELIVHQEYLIFSEDGRDELNHGTAVAGIIGATDNGFGGVGVSSGVRVRNIKCIGPPPNNSWSGVIDGFGYVYEHADQIEVVNASLGNESTNAPALAIRGIIKALVNVGVVVIAAAGNSTNDLSGADGIYGTGDDCYPAALPDVMAVSAMNPITDMLWSASNFSQVERTNGYRIGTGDTFGTNYVFSLGGAIDVAAPGVNIFTSSATGGYALVTGTSYAAPHVTGLISLYIAANGRATNAEGVYRIRQAIVDASLPQSQWNTADTEDPDTNPEPLAIASEAWIPKPVLTNAGSPGDFQLSFAAIPGYDYTVQSAPNLTPPVAWTNLVTLTTAAHSNAHPATLTDTNVADQSVYRLERAPSP